MRVLAAALAILLSGAASAQVPSTERLDRWLATLPAGSDAVVIVPRLRAVLGPLTDAVKRLREHVTIARGLAEAVTEMAGRLGGDVFDLALHQRLGLDLDGPLVIAGGGGRAGVGVVPLRSEKAVDDWLAPFADDSPTQQMIDGQPGWKLADSVGLYQSGALLLARNALDLAPLTSGVGGAPVSLEDCPRGPGEADLFVVLRPADAIGLPGVLRRGCYAVRFDPDRVRLDARLAPHAVDVVPGYFPAGDAAVWRFLGPGATSVFYAQLGPDAWTLLRTGLSIGRKAALPPAAVAALESLRGSLVAAAGPGETDFTLGLGSRSGELMPRVLEAAKAGLPSPFRLENATPAGAELAWTPSPEWPAGLPDVRRAWLGAREGFVFLSTRPPAPTGDWRAAFAGQRGRVDPAIFDGAALVLYARLTGAPGDARALTARLIPTLKGLGIEEVAVREALGALFYALGHVSEIALTARSTPRGVEIALEIVTL